MASRATWRRGLSLWGPPTIYALAIFAASSLSAPPSSSQLTDKHGHALAYAGLALVLVRALSGGRWSGVTAVAGLQAVVVAIAYGASDEWHQSFVPGRDADLWDLAANAVGAALAVGVLGAGAWWSRRSARTDGTIEKAARRVGRRHDL